jgi:hypothetical protein
MQIRRDNLEDALLLHQFLRDVEDELQWVAEKQPQAASTDLGTSLTAVQSLQKKHQASREQDTNQIKFVETIGLRNFGLGRKKSHWLICGVKSYQSVYLLSVICSETSAGFSKPCSIH